MESDNKLVLLKLRNMSNDLGIPYTDSDAQDWGIINSDASRIQEFIDYFKKGLLDKETQYSIFELIIASYNDALLENNNDQILKNIFLNFVKEYNNDVLNHIIEYWKRISTEEEFPVGKLL